jgi:hypothetical protein
MPVGYKNSKIYKIISNESGDVYIGSTTQTLAQRLAKHKNNYKRYLAGKGNKCTSYDIVKDECEIVLIEKYPCDDKEELHKRERYWIENITCVNKYVPYRSKNEAVKAYYERNRDARLQYHEAYRKANKSKRSKVSKCSCGGQYTYANKSQHLKSKTHAKRQELRNELRLMREIHESIKEMVAKIRNPPF